MESTGLPADHHALRTSTEIAVEITKEQNCVKMIELVSELNDALDREYDERHHTEKKLPIAEKNDRAAA